MKITLTGCGMGTPGSLTGEAREALREADLIIGAPRLLQSLPEGSCKNRLASTKPDDILQKIDHSGAVRVCVAYSGDTGFYSGAQSLSRLLEGRPDVEWRVIPGVSSLAYFAARAGFGWQGVRTVSAHGRQCSAPAYLREGDPVFFLTGGALGPAELCRQLCGAGMQDARVTVGEELSYPGESIIRGTAGELAVREFKPLSVMLAQWDGGEPPVPGIPDGEWIRGTVPMTKQEVRAAALAKLRVRRGDTLYDVGAGTGAVSVELAIAAGHGEVYAVEQEEDACALIRQNSKKFHVANLHLICGRAPEALKELPAPDAVFVGGSGGALRNILEAVLQKKHGVRVCISAIAVETLSEALTGMRELGFTGLDVAQISVSRAREAGPYHMMMAQNPVFLISGVGP